MSKRLSFSIAVNLLTENFKKGANTVKNSFRSMQMQIVTFAAALGAGGLGLSGLITRLKDTARETNRVITALKNISGGTAQFGDNLKYLNSLADKYGIAVNGLIESFAKFSASATQANMPMDQQRKIFESLSRASSAFGLTADENKGVMLALSQMMGKGKISSEELRKQMGEKLPVAMQAMAKAAGTSMAGLEKLLKQGKLMSADILLKFADALNEIVKDVDTDNLEASLNRLDNAFGEFTDATGFQSKYKALIDWLTSAIKSAGENIKNIVVGIVAVIAFVATNASSKVLKSWWTAASEMATGSKKLEAQLASATAARVTAQNNLETARLNHSVATGNARLRAAEKVAKAEILHARAVVAEDRARLAVTQSNATKTAGVWTKSFNVIKLGAAKLWVSLKSLWSSFAPAIIISALVAIGGYLKNIYEEAKRVQEETAKAFASGEASALKEQKELARLKVALESATKGSKEYQSIKDEIVSKFGKYHKNLSDEIEKVGILKSTYDKLTESIRLSALARAKDSELKRVEDRYEAEVSSAIKNIKTYIDKTTATPEQQAWLQKEIVSAISKGNDELIDSKEINRLKGLQNVKSKHFSKEFEKLSPLNRVLYQNIKLYDKVLEAKRANQKFDDAKKQIDETFPDLSNAIRDPEIIITPGADPDNKALKAAEKRMEALRKLDEEDRKRQIDKQKLDIDLQQKAIDVLDDSFSKRTKQTLLNLQKEKLAIEEHQNELLKQQQEHLKIKYVSVKGDDKGFGDYFSNLKKNDFKDKDGNNILPEGLTPEDIKKQVDLLLDAAQKEQEKGLRDINRDLSVMLKEQELMFASDLDRKLADLDTYYNEQLIKAGDNAELIAQIESNRKRSKSEVKVEDKLNKLDFEEQLKQERIAGMESIGMTELVEEKKLEVTKQYIQLKIAALKELADAGDEDAKNQIQLYEASLKKLDTQKPAKSLKSLADKAIFDTIKKGFQSITKDSDDAEDKTTALLGSIQSKAGTIANITQDLQSMFGGMDEGLDMAMETVGNIAQGFATGGIVGGAMAVIGEGMKLFSKASEAAARHQKALKEIEEDRLASQRAYNLLLLEQNLLLKEAVTIFGEKQITRAANAIANYRDSLGKLKDEMQGGFTPDASYEKALEQGASKGGIMGAVFGQKLKDYRKQLDNYNNGVAALGNAQIVTGHKKTGLFGWGKGKDLYSNILDVDRYKDLVKDGKLDIDMAKVILGTEEMNDETRKYIQNLIDLQDHAEAAQEELRSYLQSTFGSLGTDIMTSLENAIKDKGVSAWEAFGEAGAKVIEELGKQIAYELFFAEKFKNLQKQLEGVYGSGKDEDVIAREAMDLVGSFYQNIGSQMDLAQGFMENWQKEAEKYGLNLWKPDSSSTQDSSKGYSVSMDQDTGGAILGRVTGLHETGLRMEAFLKNISLDTSNYLSQSVSIANELKKQTEFLSEISQIQKKNFFKMDNLMEAVSPLGDMKDKLSQIEKNTKGLVTGK